MPVPDPGPARGSASNPANRFLPISVDLDGEPSPEDLEDPRPLRTTFYRDASRSVISRNASPDVGFETSLNPYRGCAHGCAYCYARPTHEYLGMSAGLDFETKILVKEDAPDLLRKELASPRWKPSVVVMSGVTDCYQPVEGKLRLTRRCLEVLAEFRNPVAIITKNALVTRDIDVLGELAAHGAASVHLSVTSLDRDLQRRLEPRTSPPAMRLDAVRRLNEAGIPAGVMAAPVIPGLNDHEIPAILEAAASAGAVDAGYVVLRLPHALKELFEAWLERHVPDRKNRVLHRIEAIRGGRLNDPRFGTRMRGEGIFAEQIAMLFEAGRRRAGLPEDGPELSTAAFRRPDRHPEPGDQLSLFEP